MIKSFVILGPALSMFAAGQYRAQAAVSPDIVTTSKYRAETNTGIDRDRPGDTEWAGVLAGLRSVAERLGDPNPRAYWRVMIKVTFGEDDLAENLD